MKSERAQALEAETELKATGIPQEELSGKLDWRGNPRTKADQDALDEANGSGSRKARLVGAVVVIAAISVTAAVVASRHKGSAQEVQTSTLPSILTTPSSAPTPTTKPLETFSVPIGKETLHCSVQAEQYTIAPNDTITSIVRAHAAAAGQLAVDQLLIPATEALNRQHGLLERNSDTIHPGHKWDLLQDCTKTP